MLSSEKKIAVVLFNLGGPDCLNSVRPFLYNIFSDRQILRIPFPFRQCLAFLLAQHRYKFTKKIYQKIGGFSPLLENTRVQAQALCLKLSMHFSKIKVFVAMRYWNPRLQETLLSVESFSPDHVILLPLYPHYSTTTTESSLQEWKLLSQDYNFKTKIVCCWGKEENFILAHKELLKKEMNACVDKGNYHILFSAHGLPKKIIALGDPYQQQIEASAKAIASDFSPESWSLSYQSRVGPLKWLGPETGAEIKRLTLSEKKDTIFLVPLSFVSEHSETLVELDIEFRKIGINSGLKNYIRIPTLSCHPLFISCLSDLVLKSLNQTKILCPEDIACAEGYE